ncbi:thiol-specific monooxygenase [Phlyctema vagabunda]|uniref:Thiol-specific monooxygenase n=1 Tax=Phlyctema vagabunda TaxID=108571 RepID=A0ABR4PVT0_9HELO
MIMSNLYGASDDYECTTPHLVLDLQQHVFLNIMTGTKEIKSVAIIGAGAAGAITTAAFVAENHFERIRVFERRGTAGGTWIYDPAPSPGLEIHPGRLPTEVDLPLAIPDQLPTIEAPSRQERFEKTPVYDSLTTNVPDIAMSFSDLPFAYGPFVPHYVPRQYIENYFSSRRLDSYLSLNTTVEDVSRIPSKERKDRWKLTLRKFDAIRNVDVWWEEEFDAVVFANGHYSVPFIPEVKGLSEYNKIFPGRVVHSKYYRSPSVYRGKNVLVIGNSASGHDVTNELVHHVNQPVHQSRRTPSRWEGNSPPEGIDWKPIIKEYLPSGRIIFEDDTYLDNIDTVIYGTGYKASFPFWNEKANGRPFWDYKRNKLVNVYWHTFLQDFPTLGIVGVPRVLTFRSFEYQAIALARLFSGRNTSPLPPLREQQKWETEREALVVKEKRNFHDIPWESGETLDWLDGLYRIAGLQTLHGEGRNPPALGKDVIWAIENIRKYPEPDKGKKENSTPRGSAAENDWVVVERAHAKDLLGFI